MTYRQLISLADEHIPMILAAYKLPSVAQFISIDEANYWNYVTSFSNVWFYKVFQKDSMVATIHMETSERTLYMDIVVFPEFQRRGIATQILHDIQAGTFAIEFDQIRISIDEKNTASIRLFEHAGFVRSGKEEELLEYVYNKH